MSLVTLETFGREPHRLWIKWRNREQRWHSSEKAHSFQCIYLDFGICRARAFWHRRIVPPGQGPRSTMQIEKADAYGVVLVNASGKVLLREPTGHFGGYAWTFAKGRPDAGENPSQTVIREAREESGYAVELLDVIPGTFGGTTSSSAFFLAGPLGAQGLTDAETSATRWVSFDEAPSLIEQSQSKTGRTRDLAILAAAKAALKRLPWDRRPATCREDWEVHPMPALRTEIALNLFFDAETMKRIAKGFFPKTMEEKWFIWYGAPFLHLHRSWSGFASIPSGSNPRQGASAPSRP